MEEVSLHFFPYPHVLQGRRRDGWKLPWHPVCSSCDRQCENANGTELAVCSYGVNYHRVDKDLLIAGIIVRDFPGAGRARRKALRIAGQQTVVRDDVEAAVRHARLSVDDLERELRARQDAIIDVYRASQGYRREIVDDLRPEIQGVLAQVHDYRQFVQQIVQNVNVILQHRFPTDEDVDSQLEKAEHEIVAIYYAARLMEQTLDAALYLMYPERIDDTKEDGTFRFHGAVTKYRRIYQRRMEAKGIQWSQSGESRAEVRGNTRAVPIIPLALIDNAIKYSPEMARVDVALRDYYDRIEFKVGSFGPKIDEDEMSKIFDPFYRGKHARKANSEGTGFGLAAAQNIAVRIGTEIGVQQYAQPGPGNSRWTEFSVDIPLDCRRRVLE